MKKLSLTVCILLASFLFLSCSSQKEDVQEKNNFTVLSQSLKKRDVRSFCSELSLASRERVQPNCEEGISSLWPQLDRLFRGAESVGREGEMFFIRKRRAILSYPLVLEKGRWRADIIGPHGWRDR